MHRFRYAVGLVTLVAVAVGLWFVLSLLGGDERQEGFPLRVEFYDARGLRPGADVRYRGVPVGSVRGVVISEDGCKAVVELFLESVALPHARVHSSFWIVSPRLEGLTGGASGLDTLVRDAYVAFLTPSDNRPALSSGSLIAGLERPPDLEEPENLEPVEHGDLLMSLLVPENHGLRPGSRVVFRGVRTGDVRSVQLAEDGSHVELRMRIFRSYRHTVTDKTSFWIARPQLSGALFSGFRVQDVGALLSQFVGYYTAPGDGLPVEDDYRAAAGVERPTFEVSPVPDAALRVPDAPEPPAQQEELRLVHVIYAAVEDDWTSPDDHIKREGTGVLYLDQTGRAVVVTARSLVDGSYTEQDTFGGDPEIKREQIKVVLPRGTVLRAGRNWVDPGGADLALLVLEGSPPDLLTTSSGRLQFNGILPLGSDPVTLHATGDNGKLSEPQAVNDGAPLPALASNHGAALTQHDQVVGIFGQRGGLETEPAMVPLEIIPEELRPAPR